MGWAEVLDAFEARIADQRAALDDGDAGEVAPFDAPDDLGPLPAHLHERATALAREAEDLVAELHGNVAALKQDLAVVRRVEASAARTGGARFVDTSA